ncbi:hypothetical protein HRbin30_00926 [bacterium HR30]|nr:hypothetical protein HRbin30_00926 [bacterium HR30]
MTSRLRSLAPENSDYATFDFRQRDAVAIEVWLPNLGEQRKV